MLNTRAEVKEMTLDQELSVIKDKTEKLLKLLSHPEPGVMLWYGAVGNVLFDLGQHLPDSSLEMLMDERKPNTND